LSFPFSFLGFGFKVGLVAVGTGGLSSDFSGTSTVVVDVISWFGSTVVSDTVSSLDLLGCDCSVCFWSSLTVCFVFFLSLVLCFFSPTLNDFGLFFDEDL